MKRLSVCVILMLFLAIGGNTQEEKFLPEVIPPSPETAALSRFTEVPVNHYTGLANVSIPIHTISVQGLSIPINLSYHGRGLKVSEVAPRTGLGWSLTYGGDVSRQVRGKADDALGNFTYFGNRPDFMTYATSEATRNRVDVRELTDPGYDFYPDQFTFSSGSTGGKFVFDYHDLKPLIQSFGDVKITYDPDSQGRIIAFQIVDANGIIYYYGKSKDGLRDAIETQYSISTTVYNDGRIVPASQGSGYEYYSSWKLMDIETPYGELISYTYTDRTFNYYTKSPDIHDTTPIQHTDSQVNSVSTARANSTENMANISKIYTRISKITLKEYQLSRIDYSKGSVVFVSEVSARQDYNGYALDKINILDHKGKKVKSFDLNYGYTTSTDQTNLLPYIKNSPVSFGKSFKRLFLDNIVEEGRDGEVLPPYEFTYNSTVLPSRFSTRQDYWGYYNGAENNGPYLRMFEYGFYKPDRRVHIENSMAGLLEEIKYPTGGRTRLTYEHNQGTPPSFSTRVKLPLINPASVSETVVTLRKSDFWDPVAQQYKDVTIDVPYYTEFNYKVNCDTHLSTEGENNGVDGCLFFFLRGGDGAQLFPGQEYAGVRNLGEQGLSFRVGLNNFPNVNEQEIHTEIGYDFQIIVTYHRDFLSTGSMYGGGKRIKKIEYLSEGTTQVKEFEYTRSTNGSGSGLVIGLPGYLNRDENNAKSFTHYFDQSSAYSSFQANTIGYAFVTEYSGTKDNNIGKTEYIFTTPEDTGGDYYVFPYHPPTDNEWLRGKNLVTRIYGHKPLENYELKKEVFNNYLYANELFENTVGGPFTHPDFPFTPEGEEYPWNIDKSSSGNVKTSILFKLPLFMRSAINSTNKDDWKYRIYYVTGGTLNLHSTIQKDYFEGSILENRTNYFYDYDQHYQLKRTEMTDSKGDVYKTVNDFSSDLIAVNRMMPVTTTTYKNDIQLTKQHTVYGADTSTSNLYIPKKIQTAKGSHALEDRAVFHEYDSKGNPVEVSKKDGTKIYYVWGYNQSQPIAKIEGYNSISTNQKTAIDNAISASNLDVDAATEITLHDRLTDLRNIFEGIQVTTFTYDPLIGVTSVTDPRGETVYYKYDKLNRLEFVKDAQENIVKENKYHYKN